MTDFRALYAELVDCLEKANWPLRHMHSFVLGGESPEDFSFDHCGFARAVLARWGRPAIEPVPVAERLPGPQQNN